MIWCLLRPMVRYFAITGIELISERMQQNSAFRRRF